MQFILVNGRSPRPQSFCTLCCEAIQDGYVREIGTGLSYCSIKCYVDHCIDTTRAFENHAMHHDPLNHFHHTLVTR